MYVWIPSPAELQFRDIRSKWKKNLACNGGFCTIQRFKHRSKQYVAIYLHDGNWVTTTEDQVFNLTIPDSDNNKRIQVAFLAIKRFLKQLKEPASSRQTKFTPYVEVTRLSRSERKELKKQEEQEEYMAGLMALVS